MPILSNYSPTTGIVELTALDPFIPNDVTELISKAKSSDVAVSRPKVLFNFLLSDLKYFEVSEIRQLIIRRGSLLPFQRNERIAFVAENFETTLKIRFASMFADRCGLREESNSKCFNSRNDALAWLTSKANLTEPLRSQEALA
jgi:hypothetical protein